PGQDWALPCKTASLNATNCAASQHTTTRQAKGNPPMKITAIETFLVDAGWRPWTFVKVTTDAGLVGYGECSSKTPYGVVGAIKDLEKVLIGQDPRAYETRFWDMFRAVRGANDGIAARAIAGI